MDLSRSERQKGRRSSGPRPRKRSTTTAGKGEGTVGSENRWEGQEAIRLQGDQSLAV